MTDARPYDRWLLLGTMALVGLGALMIYSSTSVVTPMMAKRNISEYYYFKKHLVTVFISFIAMAIAYKADRQTLRDKALPLLLVSFILLLLVFVPGLGVKAGGARRWLRLWPTTFQPSELVKLAMVFFMAWYMSWDGYRTDRFEYFLAPVAVMGVFQAVLLKQPDFGSAVILAVITLSMLYISGIRWRFLFYMGLLGSPVIYFLLKEPYRLQRITTFMDPWKHQADSGFQLVQSFISLGSGGLGGVGIGKSMQKLGFLPEVHTDFIFSLVGEELGFLVAAAVVVCFGFIFLRGVLISSMQKDSFAYYLTFGLSVMISLQALVNFCVVTGLMPTKGLPLPFISYGGSSLLVNMAVVGLLLNYSKSDGEMSYSVRKDDKMVELMKMKKARMSVYGRGL